MNQHVRAILIGATMLSAGTGLPARAQAPVPRAAAAAARGDLPPAPPIPRTGPVEGGLMRADANSDGMVTREEAIADADRRFAATDTDHDGRLSRDEMRAARRGPPLPGADGAPPRPHGADAPPPPGGGDSDRPRRATKRPQTRDEARERALRMFDRFDANRDGRVDAGEVAAFRLVMRSRFAVPDGDNHRGAPSPHDDQP